jgi:hypothetical protein
MRESGEDAGLFFDFNHLVDELEHYGLTSKAAAPVIFTLSSLLFQTVFKHKVFMKLAKKEPRVRPHLAKWVCLSKRTLRADSDSASL